MLTIKPVYKLKNVSDDLKWTTNTHLSDATPFTLISKASLTIYTVWENLFLLLHFFLQVHLHWSQEGGTKCAM